MAIQMSPLSKLWHHILFLNCSAAAIAAAAAAARIGGSQSSDQTSPPGSMSQSNLMPDQANDYIRVPDKMVGLSK